MKKMFMEIEDDLSSVGGNASYSHTLPIFLLKEKLNEIEVWEQKDVDAVPVDEDGFRYFPKGCVFNEYIHFGEKCNFGNMSIFGRSCMFGDGCILGYECKFKGDSMFGENCIFGPGSVFGKTCTFKDNCVFAYKCSFMGSQEFGDFCSFQWCSFYDYPIFGKGCRFEYGCTFPCYRENGKFVSKCDLDKSTKFVKNVELGYVF